MSFAESLRPLILASGSPQRRTLLRDLTDSFEVVAADVDETPDPLPLDVVVRRLARRKADAVARRIARGTILGADTVIDLDGELLGKPDSAAGARAMLARLSGRTHAVHTGVALVHCATGLVEDGSATSRVRFRPIAAEEIARYVASGEPMGKSGSYAIQGGAAAFLESLTGEVDNVVGLPRRLVAELAAVLAGRIAARG